MGAQTKPNFINGNQPVQNTAASAASIQAKLNTQSTMSMVIDKLARPTIAAGLGLIYTKLILNIPVMNMYGVQKALMYGLSSIVADYVGNFFSAAKIKKELGMIDVEDLIIEPLIGGAVYAGLNKYYMGVTNRMWADFVVGSAINGVAGVSALMIRMSFKYGKKSQDINIHTCKMYMYRAINSQAPSTLEFNVTNSYTGNLGQNPYYFLINYIQLKVGSDVVSIWYGEDLYHANNGAYTATLASGATQFARLDLTPIIESANGLLIDGFSNDITIEINTRQANQWCTAATASTANVSTCQRF